MRAHWLAAFAVPTALTACLAPQTDDWMSQLAPDSPCFRVNLLDGLSTDTTAELHDLFACVNRSGDFDPLVPAVTQLDAPTDQGRPAGVALATVVNALPAAGINPFRWAGVLADALDAPDQPLAQLVDIGLELLYGQPASTVRTNGGGQVADGLLAPIAPALPAAVAALRADDQALVTTLAAALADPELDRWIHTADAWSASADPAVSTVVAALPADLADARLATLDPSNDRWTGASGDSLRDVYATWVTGDDPVLPAIADETSAILSDALTRDRLEADLARFAADGTLAAAVDGAGWMSTVDVDGGPLTAGEWSALARFVRLLADTNQPMDCSVDLLLTQIDFSFGNLAVSTLKLIADVDPSTLQTTGAIYGLLFGNAVGEFVLDQAADLGVCPGLTPQVVDDLAAVEQIADPQAAALLTVLVAAIDALEEGEVDRVPALADLADDLYEAGGLLPAEELIRDVAATALIDDVAAALPPLADPQAYGLTAQGAPAADLQAALTVASWVVDRDPATGQTGFDALQPLLVAFGAEDGSWLALDRGAALLAAPDSALGDGVQLVHALVALDPALTLLHDVAAVAGDRTVTAPALEAAATAPLVDAAVDPAPGAAPDFLGRLARDGTLDDLLRLIDLVFGLVGA